MCPEETTEELEPQPAVMMPATIQPVDLADHYWIVGGHNGQVFSSGNPGWIDPNTDTEYKTWLKAGNISRPILCDGELTHVFLQRNMPPSTILACGITDFGPSLGFDEKISIVGYAGCKVTSTSDATLNGTYETSGNTWLSMKDEAQYIQTWNDGTFSGGAKTFPWPTREGVVMFKTTAKFLSVVRGLADYLSRWNQVILTGQALPSLGTTTIA